MRVSFSLLLLFAGCTVQLQVPEAVRTDTVRVVDTLQVRDTVRVVDTLEVIKLDTLWLRDTVLIRDTITFLLPPDTIRDTVALPIPDSILKKLDQPRCGVLKHSQLPLEVPLWAVSWDEGWLYLVQGDTARAIRIWDAPCEAIQNELKDKEVVRCDTVCW